MALDGTSACAVLVLQRLGLGASRPVFRKHSCRWHAGDAPGISYLLAFCWEGGAAVVLYVDVCLIAWTVSTSCCLPHIC